MNHDSGRGRGKIDRYRNEVGRGWGDIWERVLKQM